MYRLTSYTALLLLSVMLLAAHGSAQCPSNKRQLELAGSYGLIAPSDVFGQADANKKQSYSSGFLFLTVRYFLFNRLALGFTGGTVNNRGAYATPYDPAVTTSTYTEQVTTIAPELYYIYFFRKYLEIYTLLGIGPGFFTTTTSYGANPYQPAAATTVQHNAVRMQYTPVGIRFGGRIGGFAELGIGYKGIVNAGISFRLGPSAWWRG